VRGAGRASGETDGGAPISKKTRVGEGERALSLSPPTHHLTWLYLAQKAGVATPPGLTAMTPPPSAGSQEKEAMYGRGAEEAVSSGA